MGFGGFKAERGEYFCGKQVPMEIAGAEKKDTGD